VGDSRLGPLAVAASVLHLLLELSELARRHALPPYLPTSLSMQDNAPQCSDNLTAVTKSAISCHPGGAWRYWAKERNSA
jgi:hypothetical protein